MGSSTSRTKLPTTALNPAPHASSFLPNPIVTAGNGKNNANDLAVSMAVQHDELVEASNFTSNLHFALQTCLNDVIASSALASSPDHFAGAADQLLRDMERLMDEQASLQLLKAELQQITDNTEIAEQPADGIHDLGFTEYFNFHFKGLVLEDQKNRTKLGAIGVAIFNPNNSVVLEVSKPLVLPHEEMTAEVAELEAFVHGLELALSLEVTRIGYDSLDFHIDSYLIGDQKPTVAKIAELVDRAVLLKNCFLDCHLIFGEVSNAQLVFELTKSSIEKHTKQIILNKEECPICLEDMDSTNLYEITHCHHRFCSSCIQKHVEHKVLSRELPRCPQPNCVSDINISMSRSLLSPEMYDIMDQLVIEYSIPVAEKVYCPNPKCSNLMSKGDALKTSQSVAGTSRVELAACRCLKCHILFCINCKVPWHSNISCEAFRLVLETDDAKLKMLAAYKRWRLMRTQLH